ncbi:hypothetical protein [Helicobacter pylori]|uniref:Uncharacterized protein n=1 Tax=Helicobacter pylori UM037 TaxID=1321939 RepID=A0AB33Z6V9_HELPX|nr:hypothetical protein [Helicobacter pylori]EQK94321.1 hypothetical protein N198_08330 [Helicobacter pylori UM037]
MEVLKGSKMITYEIDAQQLKKPKKTILEAKSKLFLSVSLALILLAFYLIFKVEGV